MRALPNMSIFSPADTNTTAALVDIALQSQNPIYIRLDREKLPTLYRKNKINYSQGISTHYKGDDICIISTGLMVHRAIEVADSLRSYSIHAKVIDVYRLKPLNIDAIKVAIVKSKKIITIEEHTINGGLGSMIAEMLADLAINIPLKRLAIEDKFLCAYGVRENLHRERGLDTESIVEFIIKWLQ
jgi:transketolase